MGRAAGATSWSGAACTAVGGAVELAMW